MSTFYGSFPGYDVGCSMVLLPVVVALFSFHLSLGIWVAFFSSRRLLIFIVSSGYLAFDV